MISLKKFNDNFIFIFCKNIKEEYPKIILPNKISILYLDKKKYGSLKIQKNIKIFILKIVALCESTIFFLIV